MGKKGGKRNINTLRRVRLVCAIVKEHYEPGVLRKCYKAVWREHVYPVYPMCYRTFLNYVSTLRLCFGRPKPRSGSILPTNSRCSEDYPRPQGRG